MSSLSDLPVFAALLDELYEGPFEPNPFNRFLRKLRELLNLNVACVIMRQPEGDDGGLIFVSSNRVDMTAVDTHDNPYTDHYYSMDPMVDLPYRQVVTLDEIVPNDELEESEFFRIYLAKSNVHYMAGIDLKDANGERYNVRLCRRKSAGNFTEEEREFLSLLAGHIERSVANGMRLVQMDSERQMHTSAVSGRSIATITLDENCRVLRTNGAAEMLINANDGILIHREQLQTRQPELNDKLREIMQNMLSAQRREEVVPAQALAIPRPSGEADYEFLVKAIPVDRYVETRNSPHLMVLINDPANNPTVSMSALMDLYGLTNSEAKISVLLSQGKTLDDVSSELGIARNTARAHLRAIYSKTGVTQQSMLVSLVLKSLASHS